MVVSTLTPEELAAKRVSGYGVFVPTLENDITAAFTAQCGGADFYDLGAGDGRTLAWATAHGANSVGGIEVDVHFEQFTSTGFTIGDFFTDNTWESKDLLYYYIYGCRREQELVQMIKDSENFSGKLLLNMKYAYDHDKQKLLDILSAPATVYDNIYLFNI